MFRRVKKYSKINLTNEENQFTVNIIGVAEIFDRSSRSGSGNSCISARKPDYDEKL